LCLPILSACAGCGAPPPPPSLELPALPAALRTCSAAADVAPPAAGAMNAREVFALIAALKASGDGKESCNVRLIAWYDSIRGDIGK
jgi:hypothetical protein